jgi:ubiquinone/menaquinone biosynthesis C-methylase UbiE
VPAIEIAERMGNKSTVYAIDHWDTALKRAEIKASQLDVNNVIFKNASVLDMPFNDSYFDLVVSNNCLNNIAEYDSALKECCRVLKSGGRLIQMFNLPDTLREFYDVYRMLLIEKGMSQEIEKLNNHIHEKRKDTEYTVKETEKAGFGIIDISAHCFPWRFNNGTSLLNYSFVKIAWLPN